MESLLAKLKAIPAGLNQFFERYEPTVRAVYRLGLVLAAFQIASAISHSQNLDTRGVAGELSEISHALDSIRRVIVLKQ